MTEDAVTDVAVIEVEPQQSLTIFGTDDPVLVVQKATDIANALRGAILQMGMTTSIQGREYVLAEGWAFMGALIGVSPRALSVDVIEIEACTGHDVCAYEARVELVTKSGDIVGGAIAECSFHERNWADRDAFALKSMAQTRATGKAFRLAYGFVMKAAGYEATPAEEMVQPTDRAPVRAPARRSQPREGGTGNGQIKTLGDLFTWAKTKHDLTRPKVLELLECKESPDVMKIGLEAAQILVDDAMRQG